MVAELATYTNVAFANVVLANAALANVALARVVLANVALVTVVCIKFGVCKSSCKCKSKGPSNEILLLILFVLLAQGGRGVLPGPL